MTIITTKTNGQFPSRKNGETNVLRPVVSQSKMYNKSLRMSNYLIRISIVLFMLLLFSFSFREIGIDFNLVLMKLQSILLGKSLHFLFSRLGWCVFGIMIFSVLLGDFLWYEQRELLHADTNKDGESGSRPRLGLRLGRRSPFQRIDKEVLDTQWIINWIVWAENPKD